MGRARSPSSIEAERLYRKGWKLVDIAKELNVPEGTVRRWKSTQDWESERSDKKANVRKLKGGQPGNKNAVGNNGGAPGGNKNALGNNGGAPKQNKNAVTTGEFETLLFDCLDSEELTMIEQIQLDKNQLLLQEIQLLTVRERRMLKRIEALKRTEDENNGIGKDMTAVKYKTGVEKGKSTDLFEYAGILGQIQSVENALTRVQASKQRAIDSLHRYGYDDARLEIELMKIELELAKQDTQDDSQEDDGFMDAINKTVAEVWGDDDV